MKNLVIVMMSLVFSGVAMSATHEHEKVKKTETVKKTVTEKETPPPVVKEAEVKTVNIQAKEAIPVRVEGDVKIKGNACSETPKEKPLPKAKPKKAKECKPTVIVKKVPADCPSCKECPTCKDRVIEKEKIVTKEVPTLQHHTFGLTVGNGPKGMNYSYEERNSRRVEGEYTAVKTQGAFVGVHYDYMFDNGIVLGGEIATNDSKSLFIGFRK